MIKLPQIGEKNKTIEFLKNLYFLKYIAYYNTKHMISTYKQKYNTIYTERYVQHINNGPSV